MKAKRMLTLLLCLILCLLPVAGAGAVTLQGAGTEEDPYLIGTAEELRTFAEIVNSGVIIPMNGGFCVRLTEDIDLGGIDEEGNGIDANRWTPLGMNAFNYTGVFDGGGHTVSGIYVHAEGGDDGGNPGKCCGFFGFLSEEAKVRDLCLKGSVTVALTDEDEACVGGVAGISTGEITGCRFTGSVLCTGKSDPGVYAGGIAGISTGKITDCRFTGSVSGTGKGLCSIYAGGIAGSCTAGLAECQASGPILGEVDGNGCEVSGTAVPRAITGGGVGAGSSLTDCRADCKVSAEATGPAAIAWAGGIAGTSLGSGGITRCWASGEVDAEAAALMPEYAIVYKGALAGVTDSVSGCFYLTGMAQNAAGDGDAGPDAALTAEQLTDRSIFSGADWDLDNVWFMDPGGPLLRAFLPAADYLDPTDAESPVKTCAEYDSVVGLDELKPGWYAVLSDTVLPGRVGISGSVNLILTDGTALTVPKGITVEGEGRLRVWAQSDGESMGALLAGTTDGTDATCQTACAGIGSASTRAGAITINGGRITAAGSGSGIRGAGIGGNRYNSISEVTVSGGEITAVGGQYAAGIGNGPDNTGEDAGKVTITGGRVNASSAGNAAGIGGGTSGKACDVELRGGTVTARAGSYEGDYGAAPQAVGCGEVPEASGAVALELGLRVYASETVESPVAFEAREKACRGEWAQIEPCRFHACQGGICRWCGCGVAVVREWDALQVICRLPGQKKVRLILARFDDGGRFRSCRVVETETGVFEDSFDASGGAGRYRAFVTDREGRPLWEPGEETSGKQ